VDGPSVDDGRAAVSVASAAGERGAGVVKAARVDDATLDAVLAASDALPTSPRSRVCSTTCGTLRAA
jgi:hypothetical protein